MQRCRVIIFDDGLQKRAPAFEYFERTGLMHCTTVEETTLPMGCCDVEMVAANWVVLQLQRGFLII